MDTTVIQQPCPACGATLRVRVNLGRSLTRVRTRCVQCGAEAHIVADPTGATIVASVDPPGTTSPRTLVASADRPPPLPSASLPATGPDVRADMLPPPLPRVADPGRRTGLTLVRRAPDPVDSDRTMVTNMGHLVAGRDQPAADTAALPAASDVQQPLDAASAHAVTHSPGPTRAPWIAATVILTCMCGVLGGLWLRDHPGDQLAASARQEIGSTPADNDGPRSQSAVDISPSSAQAAPWVRPLDPTRPFTVRLSSQRFAPDAFAVAHGASLRGLPALFLDGVEDQDGRWYHVHSGEFATASAAEEAAARLVRAKLPSAEVFDRREDVGRTVAIPAEESLAHATLKRFDVLAPAIVKLLRSLPYDPELRIDALVGVDLSDAVIAKDKAMAVDLTAAMVAAKTPAAKATAKELATMAGTAGAAWVSVGMAVDALDDQFQVEVSVGAVGVQRCRIAAAVYPGRCKRGVCAQLDADLTAGTCRILTSASPAAMERGRTWLRRNPDEAGLLHAGELYRSLNHLVDAGQAGGSRPWVIALSRLTRRYAADKGNAGWARRMIGFWNFTAMLRGDAAGPYRFELFDLGTPDNARQVQEQYDTAMRRATNVPAAWKRLLGLGSRKRVDVDGTRAWYVDGGHGSGNYREVNLRLGPFAMLVGTGKRSMLSPPSSAQLATWLKPLVQWTRTVSADRMAGDTGNDDVLPPVAEKAYPAVPIEGRK